MQRPILSIIVLCGLIFKAVCASTISNSNSESCVYPGTCIPPARSYTAGRDVVPRKQWGDSGGFCGALSIQAIGLSYGAWISQDLIRKAAPKGEGHGNPIQGYEILHSNIEEALANLHFTYDSWDWEGSTHPQGSDYLGWLKQQLLQDNGVVQFVLCKGDSHNAYGTDEDPNYYDHIEPFFKLYTDHSLDNANVYGDDVVAHGSDYSPDGILNLGYFRNFSSLLDDLNMAGNCSEAGPHYGQNEMYPCIYNDVVYGYAMTGLDCQSCRSGAALPVVLKVNTTDEPDVREGEDPVLLQGSAYIDGLSIGSTYTVYRWNSYEDFPTTGTFDASNYAVKFDFVADAEQYSFVDQDLFLSNGSVVYSCIKG